MRWWKNQHCCLPHSLWQPWGFLFFRQQHTMEKIKTLREMSDRIYIYRSCCLSIHVDELKINFRWRLKITGVGLKASDVCSAVVLVVASLRLLLDTETDQHNRFNTPFPNKHFLNPFLLLLLLPVYIYWRKQPVHLSLSQNTTLCVIKLEACSCVCEVIQSWKTWAPFKTLRM